MPKKPTTTALAATELRLPIAQDGKPKAGFGPSVQKGQKGGGLKPGNAAIKRMPVPGKGWGR